MLQCHIHWVNSLCDEECTPKKNRLNDDVVPQSTLCRVLDCFISAMRKVHYCENDELVKLDILLQNFELSCEDIKHLHEWNSYCGGGMKLSPVIGVDLLENLIDEVVSQKELELFEEEQSHDENMLIGRIIEESETTVLSETSKVTPFSEISDISQHSAFLDRKITPKVKKEDAYNDKFFSDLLWSSASIKSLSIKEDESSTSSYQKPKVSSYNNTLTQIESDNNYNYSSESFPSLAYTSRAKSFSSGGSTINDTVSKKNNRPLNTELKLIRQFSKYRTFNEIKCAYKSPSRFSLRTTHI